MGKILRRVAIASTSVVAALGRHQRRRYILSVAVIASMALFAAVLGGTKVVGASAGTASSHVTPIRFTPAEAVEWKQETATPFQREAIFEKIQAAFTGVAQVGSGPMPNSTKVAAVAPSPTPTDRLMYTAGFTSTHFWVVFSYADAAAGDIAAAVILCSAGSGLALTFVCAALGSLAYAMTRGWGQGNAHGVWIDAWWWPPHLTSGRW